MDHQQIPTMVSPDTFRSYSVEGKLNTIFDYVYGIHEWQRQQCEVCEKRLNDCNIRFDDIESKVENLKSRRSALIAGYSGIGGVVGGTLAIGIRWILSLITK